MLYTSNSSLSSSSLNWCSCSSLQSISISFCKSNSKSLDYHTSSWSIWLKKFGSQNLALRAHFTLETLFKLYTEFSIIYSYLYFCFSAHAVLLHIVYFSRKHTLTLTQKHPSWFNACLMLHRNLRQVCWSIFFSQFVCCILALKWNKQPQNIHMYCKKKFFYFSALTYKMVSFFIVCLPFRCIFAVLKSYLELYSDRFQFGIGRP